MRKIKNINKTKIRVRTSQPEDPYTEMMFRFAIAAEYKDDDIGQHIIRVSDYSVAIARGLKCRKKEVEYIKFASIMHDIGKIGIPDKILHKKRLNSNDYDKIKEHTLIGSRIFAGSDFLLLNIAGEVALYHHEWYNGKGYPRGLKGDKIPLYARIVALADSFDVIVSHRSYKKSKSLDKAIKIIKKQKGTQFDPKVVDAFFKALPVIKKILNANKTINAFIKENKDLLRKEKKGSVHG